MNQNKGGCSRGSGEEKTKETSWGYKNKKKKKKPNQGSNCICQERKLKRQSGKLKK